jgi:hypothetical protein
VHTRSKIEIEGILPVVECPYVIFYFGFYVDIAIVNEIRHETGRGRSDAQVSVVGIDYWRYNKHGKGGKERQV